jgi:hypothetical protein
VPGYDQPVPPGQKPFALSRRHGGFTAIASGMDLRNRSTVREINAA